MKIYDCFMYFDEDVILDLRLNILNPFIDYFVIVESTFNHKGEKRKLKFDIKKYKKFEKKIIYLIFDEEPSGIEKVFDIKEAISFFSSLLILDRLLSKIIPKLIASPCKIGFPSFK